MKQLRLGVVAKSNDAKAGLYSKTRLNTGGQKDAYDRDLRDINYNID